MLWQAWTRFKVFTQRDVAPYVLPFRHCPASWLHIDRCADELVDAFIAVHVTSLFRGGVPRHLEVTIVTGLSRSRIPRRASASPCGDRDRTLARPCFLSGIFRNRWIERFCARLGVRRGADNGGQSSKGCTRWSVVTVTP